MRPSFEPLQPDAIRFLSEKTGGDFTGYDYSAANFLCITVRSPEGSVQGVMTGEFTSKWEAHMTVALADPGIITRRLLHAMFSTLFSRAVRVTAYCRPDNAQSESCIRRLGFLYEGYLRLGLEGKWDALAFGMLRPECRWIRAPKETRHEIAKPAKPVRHRVRPAKGRKRRGGHKLDHEQSERGHAVR